MMSIIKLANGEDREFSVNMESKEFHSLMFQRHRHCLVCICGFNEPTYSIFLPIFMPPKEEQAEYERRIGFRRLSSIDDNGFLNCFAQVLTHTPLLSDYFVSERHECDERNSFGCLVCEVSNLFNKNFDKCQLSLDYLNSLIWEYKNIQYIRDEENAHSTFICFIDVLHRHLRDTEPQSSCNESDISMSPDHSPPPSPKSSIFTDTNVGAKSYGSDNSSDSSNSGECGNSGGNNSARSDKSDNEGRSDWSALCNEKVDSGNSFVGANSGDNSSAHSNNSDEEIDSDWSVVSDDKVDIGGSGNIGGCGNTSGNRNTGSNSSTQYDNSGGKLNCDWKHFSDDKVGTDGKSSAMSIRTVSTPDSSRSQSPVLSVSSDCSVNSNSSNNSNSIHNSGKNTPLPWQSQCNCIIHQIFGGMLQIDVVCQKCKNVSTTIEPFWKIPIEICNGCSGHGSRKSDCLWSEFQRNIYSGASGDIDSDKKVSRPKTLIDYFESNTRGELLRSSPKIKCCNCNSLQESTTQFSLRTLPSVVTLHLKRVNLFATSNNSKFISFPLELDMSPFMSDKNDAMNDGDFRYSLYAVISHVGNNCSNYYKAFIRCGKDEWAMCIDQIIEKATVEQVLASVAYLLFYRKNSLEWE